MPAETPAFFCFCEERNDTANIAHSLRRHCERSEAIQSRVFNARKTRLQQSQAPHARLLDGARFARKDSWRFASVVIARSRRRRGNPSNGSHSKMDCRVASLLAMTRLNGIDLDHPFRTGASATCAASGLLRFARKDSWRFASVVIARSRRRRGNPSDGRHAKMDCRGAHAPRKDEAKEDKS